MWVVRAALNVWETVLVHIMLKIPSTLSLMLELDTGIFAYYPFLTCDGRFSAQVHGGPANPIDRFCAVEIIHFQVLVEIFVVEDIVVR